MAFLERLQRYGDRPPRVARTVPHSSPRPPAAVVLTATAHDRGWGEGRGEGEGGRRWGEGVLWSVLVMVVVVVVV